MSLSPSGAHPLSGAMLVLIQVSSMKTRRSGSIRSCRSTHCVRRRATSGRSRSLATTVFFEAELLGLDEVPHRTVIDLEAAIGQLAHQTAQREGALPHPLRQKRLMLAADRFRFVPARS